MIVQNSNKTTVTHMVTHLVMCSNLWQCVLKKPKRDQSKKIDNPGQIDNVHCTFLSRLGLKKLQHSIVETGLTIMK